MLLKFMILCLACKQLILQCRLLHSSKYTMMVLLQLRLCFRDEFRLKWVDDTHALGVFSSASLGKVALDNFYHHLLLWCSPQGAGYGVPCIQSEANI